jgi:hypothetical protein
MEFAARAQAAKTMTIGDITDIEMRTAAVATRTQFVDDQVIPESDGKRTLNAMYHFSFSFFFTSPDR